MLKFKVDENMPAEVASMLAQAGHDASSVPEQGMSGRPDADVAGICRQEDRAVVTLDLGFADIRAYPPADYAGIIVFRLSRLDKQSVLMAVRRMLPLLDQEPLAGKLWIVGEGAVRIRS